VSPPAPSSAGRRHALLARLGFESDRAVPLLEHAGWWVDGQLVAEREPLLRELADAVDPHDALRAVTELATGQPGLFAEVLLDEDWRSRLIAVAGTSRPLGELVARYEDAARSLRNLRPVVADEIAELVDKAVRVGSDEADRAAGIASIRRRATADIAARDLTGAITVDQVGNELAALAEGVLAGTLRGLHALAVGDADPAARLAVIGMGKLGGRELNYVSDVDVVFVHKPTQDSVGAEDAARVEATTVFEALLRLLNASTTMGRAYEVDPTLRPEGRRGALSRMPDSFVAYWERWAKTWEFQALIKARAVAGDVELGQELLERAEPFVWPDELDPGVVQEVRSMKKRVEAKPEVTRDGERQVKLGPGGLRDIEFAVQLLQLVHGRADRSLRAPGTLPALEALARGGYIAEDDAGTFSSAYRELRIIEHRLQLAHERRTHTIPDDEERQEWLARAVGYRPREGEPARVAFRQRLRLVQADVRDLHTKLFYRPLLEAHAQVPARDAGLALPEGARHLDENAAIVRLEALGFRDARGVLRDVRALTDGLSRTAKALQVVLPALLHHLAETPDPDGGLKAFRDVVEAHGHKGKLLASLRDHPPAADVLARVLGTSPVAGVLLAAQPDAAGLLLAEARVEVNTRDAGVSAAIAQLGWHEGLDARTDALRRFKRKELLRVVLRDLIDGVPVSTTGEELTWMAEAALEAGLVAVFDDLSGNDQEAASDRGGHPARFVVIGMGKFGGRELHYSSDLDVLFVHEPGEGAREQQALEFALQVAERLVRTLGTITPEGSAFEVDPDLRPEGRSGPLSRSLDSYAAYYQRWSEPWEHQALLRARVVAGDADLGRRFLALVRPLAYPASFPERQAVAMRKMKARIERERLPRRGDPKRNLKLGPGGLIDVEWTVQLLQQRHGASEPLLASPSTMRVLDGAQDAGLLSGDDVQWLREGYRLLWAIRNRLYLMRQREVDVLPQSLELLDRLAHSLGYGRGGRQDLEEDYLRVTRRVRRVVERLFYEADES